MEKRAAKTIIPEGSLFLLTHGSYSDYEMMTVCRAKIDIDTHELRESYLLRYPKQRSGAYFEESQFIAWVIVEVGVAEEVPCWEWHVSDYHNVSEMSLDTVEPHDWTKELKELHEGDE